MLTERVRARDATAAGFVHWGATSQDVADTALVLLLRRCRAVLEADHERVIARAAAPFGRTRRHRDAGAHSVAAGAADHLRTEGGRAGWAAVRRGWARVASRFDEALYLQFGGASGTLAALGRPRESR